MSRTLCCIAVLWAAAFADAAAQNVALAPAFTPSDLMAPPRQHWITNGGNLFNQRYSPLARIDRENVGQLRALWRTSMGSGAGFRNSGQAQILAFAGVLYVANGENDVFAMDVKTGAILWKHTGAPDVGSGNPLGWANCGAALDDGKVFVSQVDAKLKALDQRTGEVLWRVQAERWQDGFSITSAPLFYDGHVITGFSGGEMGVRGRVKAFDARDGSLVWTFFRRTVSHGGSNGAKSATAAPSSRAAVWYSSDAATDA